ncbi:hypothetical protein KC19_7G030200 [Ceratodon purpureus]|uniref:Uncharacterized protein n=1 Tax=Ceratodon purpureus TaxID=3225 RepID=A0A8T0H746_CERPU|nr:hypothetical protein KC19_7G030200 [Ceratodon purpureus]
MIAKRTTHASEAQCLRMHVSHPHLLVRIWEMIRCGKDLGTTTTTSLPLSRTHLRSVNKTATASNEEAGKTGNGFERNKKGGFVPHCPSSQKQKICDVSLPDDTLILP